MTVETKLIHPFEYLERFRPNCPQDAWHFVALGGWAESPYHAGSRLYQIAKNEEMNTWVIISTDIDDEEEDIDEDIDEDGDDNADEEEEVEDDEEEDSAPIISLPEVIAICRDAPEDATIEEMAKDMYDVLWDVGLGLDD